MYVCVNILIYMYLIRYKCQKILSLYVSALLKTFVNYVKYLSLCCALKKYLSFFLFESLSEKILESPMSLFV